MTDRSSSMAGWLGRLVAAEIGIEASAILDRDRRQPTGRQGCEGQSPVSSGGISTYLEN